MPKMEAIDEMLGIEETRGERGMEGKTGRERSIGKGLGRLREMAKEGKGEDKATWRVRATRWRCADSDEAASCAVLMTDQEER